MTARLNVVDADDLNTLAEMAEALNVVDRLLEASLSQVAVVQGLVEAKSTFHVQVGPETIVDSYVVGEVLNNARLQLLDGVLQLREVHTALEHEARGEPEQEAA